MVAVPPYAHDAVFVFRQADGAERTIAVGSPDWYTWLADADHRTFVFECGAGRFTARKERKQRGGWYWVAYHRAQRKIHKAYLGKSDELILARLRGVAALLAERAAASGDRRVGASVRSPDAYPTSPTWPGGTVTFLFTDIAGSTRLWEQHPQAMPTALARHDAILRAAVLGHGGVVFKTVGDAICAAFASAPAAVEAALTAQRALNAEAWGTTGPLNVRMALHTGTAEARDGDYLGPPLNRVARLLAVGHGGQVLLSHATAQLVGDALPASLTLRDLGAHSLKDLRRPERIFQLVSPDLPADFPPPRGADTRPAPASAQPSHILTTKLYVPPPHPNLVSRPHLIAQLHAGRRGKLILISAPAGSGKTTLLGEWIAAENRKSTSVVRRPSSVAGSYKQRTTDNRQRTIQVAWVSLDDGDRDPVRFWSYVITALDALQPGVGAAALAALQSPQPPPITALLTGLLNALNDLPGDTLLVLDDYHVIDALAIHQAVGFLLDHLPPHVHLIIATRSDPPLPLARLRARGELTELRAADLRFTVAEAAVFLTETRGLPLSAAEVAALEARTEGWIAGLQLAALAMRERADLAGFVAAFAGSNRFVMDYLASEVLDRLPAHLQTFVNVTSILDRMCGPLCDAVLGLTAELRMEDRRWRMEDRDAPSSNARSAVGDSYSQLILEELERGNLFIMPLDDAREWYRYHHLFAEVLRGRLTRGASQAAVAVLHRRASAWFEQQGLLSEAVHHALAAADWEGAAGLIEQGGRPAIARGQVQTVLGWLNALPDAHIRARAWLCVLHALTLLFTNDLAAAEVRLQAAEQSLQANTLADQARTMLGHIATIRSAIVHFSGDLAGCVALAHQALDLLPETDALARPLALVLAAHAYRVNGDVTPAAERQAAAVAAPVHASGNLLAYLGVWLNLAELQVVQGRLHQASASYAEAAQVAPESGGLQVLVGSPAYYFGMGELLREWNDLDAAEHHLAPGMELVRGALTVHADVAALGYITLARLQHARGDAIGAIATLGAFSDLAHRRSFAPLVTARAAAAQAQLALAQGDLTAATRWADTSGLHADDDLSYPHESEYLALARVLIARGRADPAGSYLRDALGLLGRLLRQAEAGARTSSAIEIRILQALALQAQGDRAAALAALASALALAAAEGYVRMFVDEGAPIRLLIADCRLQIEQQAHDASGDNTRRLLAYIDTLLAAFPSDSSILAPQSAIYNLQSAMVEPLTVRELEVLRLIAAGASNREIARRLVITVGTVKRHINNLFSKLDVHSRTQAISAARTLDLLET